MERGCYLETIKTSCSNLFCPYPPIPFFGCLVYILLILIYSSISLSVLNFLPPHHSFSNRFEAGALLSLARNLQFPQPSIEVKIIIFPGKLGQCTNAHFPGAYLGINCLIRLPVGQPILGTELSGFSSHEASHFYRLSA